MLAGALGVVVLAGCCLLALVAFVVPAGNHAASRPTGADRTAGAAGRPAATSDGSPGATAAAEDGNTLPSTFDGYVSSGSRADSQAVLDMLSPVPPGTTGAYYHRGTAVVIVGLTPSAALRAHPVNRSPFKNLAAGTVVCGSTSHGGYCQRGGRIRTILVISNVSAAEARKALGAILGE